MIGIFDSGTGGLSVFREIFRLLPEERYIYYSDNANCPYGEKTKEFITDRARAISSFLIDQGADIIVVACNTATAAAISSLRAEFPICFIGMEPAVKPAAQKTRTGVVGVLATAGTLKASKYIDTREKWAQDVKIVEHIGQGFVELVENGILDGPEAEAIVEKSIRPLIEAGADTIVLGCTHYPFLAVTIKKTARCPVELIDPAPAVAKHLLEVMQEKGLVHKDGFSMTLHSSGDSTTLERIYNNLIQTI
jgi:glutamate racemase